jgi:phage virion morphogenesis protein
MAGGTELMTGSAVEITHNGPELDIAVGKIADRFGSTLPAMQIIGETVTESVQRNFEKGGRPDGWKPLSTATLAAKRGGSVLVGKGFGGGLLGSIHSEPEEHAVYIGTDKVYAAIHQFGGQAGRGLKTTIAKREFLMVQDEDVTEFVDLLEEYILTGQV